MVRLSWPVPSGPASNTDSRVSLRIKNAQPLSCSAYWPEHIWCRYSLRPGAQVQSNALEYWQTCLETCPEAFSMWYGFDGLCHPFRLAIVIFECLCVGTIRSRSGGEWYGYTQHSGQDFLSMPPLWPISA
eukprot:8275630-Pyramimonas_sp.AAC.1